MASAWGLAWGSSWTHAWGTIGPVYDAPPVEERTLILSALDRVLILVRRPLPITVLPEVRERMVMVEAERRVVIVEAENIIHVLRETRRLAA